MPGLGAQPRHIGLRIVPTHTDDGISSGLRKAWRMPVALGRNEFCARIKRNAAVGVRPMSLRHKFSIFISSDVESADREPVPDRDRMLRYRTSAQARQIRQILTLLFPRRCPHSQVA